MENYERQFRRNHDRVDPYNQHSNRNQGGQGYQGHYQNRDEYSGRANSGYGDQYTRSAEGSDFGHRSAGPGGGFGASGHSGSQHRDDRQRSNYSDSQNRSDRGSSYSRNQSYGPGSTQGRSINDHYRHGDPDSHLDYKSGGGYERTRGTGWSNESGNYEGAGNQSRNPYNRQDNSYTSGGQGRRFESFGRDEQDNFGHNMRGRLDHGHVDRGEHDRPRSDNDYTPARQYGSSDRASNRPPQWRNVSDKYSQNRNQGMFDHTDDNYPRSSRYDGHRSGPDYSADSAASDYSPGDLRG